MDNKPNMPPASNNTADAFNKPQGDSRQQATSSSAEIRKDVDRATGKVADAAKDVKDQAVDTAKDVKNAKD